MTLTSAMPDPRAWPKCKECATAYVLRRMLSITEGYRWLWQRDCKHKTVEAVIETNAEAAL